MAGKKEKTDLLIYAAPDVDADIYYATHFSAPDPFSWFRIKGKSYAFMRSLEEERARKESTIDEIITSDELNKKLKKKGHTGIPSEVDYIIEVAAMHKVKSFTVPGNFPLAIADKLRVKGLNIVVKEGAFFDSRLIKTDEEIKHIANTEKAVLKSADEIRKVLSACKIGSKNRLMYKGKTLTSEKLRAVVENFLYENGYLPFNTIIAGGVHGSEPHNTGSGPLFAHKPIVCDIFPRSRTNYYWGDFTRTFCVGKPSATLVKMYNAVKEANEAGIKMVKPGINAKSIHRKCADILEARGFKTEIKNGRWVGFFHGTGHGVGLEIHEMPPISVRDHKIRAGEVFTVEPGLYYPEEGGVRIEDLLVVTKTGCKVLSKYPKQLVIKPKR